MPTRLLLAITLITLAFLLELGKSFTNYAHNPKDPRPLHAPKPPRMKPLEHREVHEEFLKHCREGHTDTLIEMRYKYDIDLNYVSFQHHKETALMSAILNGNYRVVEYLLHAGADPTIPAKYGRSPMHASAEHGYGDIIRLLVEHGIGDVNEWHRDGYRPLHRACLGHAGYSESHGDAIKALIEAGADPHMVTDAGETPLVMAAERGRLHIVASLLHFKDKIDVDHVSAAHPYTALQTLAKHARRTDEYREIIKLFVEAGADFDRPEPNKWAETPRDKLTRKGFVIPEIGAKEHQENKPMEEL